MTTTRSGSRAAAESATISREAGIAVVVAPVVAKALPVVTGRLRERYPGLSAEIVEHHVNVAAVRLTGDARIHDYLPILIEPNASTSLSHCHIGDQRVDDR